MYLLESLGYIVHPEKTVTIPSQEIDFLGMTVDSRTMELRKPGQKPKKTLSRGGKDQRSTSHALSSRSVTPTGQIQLGDTSSSTEPPVLQSDTDRPGHSSGEEQSELQCSMPTIPSIQRGARLVDTPANTLEWEESGNDTTRPPYRIRCLPHRWGAYCEGTYTGGPWSTREKQFHINCLELLAATLAVKTFLKNQENKHVLLLLDNTTAVAFVNNLGGTVSAQATKLARELWMWCLERQIHFVEE